MDHLIWRIYWQMWNLLLNFHHQTMPIWAYGKLTYSGQAFQLWKVWLRFHHKAVTQRPHFELSHLKNVSVKNAIKRSPGRHSCRPIQLMSTLDMNISIVNCTANVSRLSRNWTHASSRRLILMKGKRSFAKCVARNELLWESWRGTRGLLIHPSIAHLVKRWTVVGLCQTFIYF